MIRWHHYFSTTDLTPQQTKQQDNSKTIWHVNPSELQHFLVSFSQCFVAFLKGCFYFYFSSGAWKCFEWQIYWLPVSFHCHTKWLRGPSTLPYIPHSRFTVFSDWQLLEIKASILSASVCALSVFFFFTTPPIARSYSLFQKMLSGDTRYQDAFKHKLTWFSTTPTFSIKLSVLGSVFLSCSLTRLLHSWADSDIKVLNLCSAWIGDWLFDLFVRI